MPLVEWAPMGHCNPKEEYANVSIHKPPRNSLLRNRAIFSAVTEANKKLFLLLYEAERSMYTFRALTGQSRDSWLPVGGGESTESAMTWALNGVESTLGT